MAINTTGTATELLVPILRANPTWRDLIDAFDWLLINNVDAPTAQLEKLRFITTASDPGVLSNTARLLGFDLSQDVLDLNGTNLSKLVTQLPLYADKNGTDLFINFLDLVFNSVTTVQYLYTDDYVTFTPSPAGPLVTEGGRSYKTTHIRLTTSFKELQSLMLQEGQSLGSRIKDLFYSYSPIALVVERMSLGLIISDADWLGGQAFGIGAHIQRAPELTMVMGH